MASTETDAGSAAGAGAVVDSAVRVGRGRPQMHDDAEVFAAALVAFAEVGYDAMSIRSLSRSLGLSHGAINQRFGSKERLFRDAVDYGFSDLRDAMAEHSADWPASDGVDMLRSGIRAFLLASAERPQIVRLMNTLGIAPSELLDYVFETHVLPIIEPLREAALVSAPTALARISTRDLFFLVAHGAAAAFSLRGLSERFDGIDGPLAPGVYAEHMAEALCRTLGV